MKAFTPAVPVGDIITGRIISFLEDIGIPVIISPVPESSFLPGMHVEKGTLLVDPGKMLSPGDMLHEAGHIAVMTPEDRYAIAGDIGSFSDQDKAAGEEFMAIAWSYAACVYLGIEPAVVFHEHGYKGAASWYIEQFTSGIYIGLPMLQWIGLCRDQKNAAADGVAPYPHMLRWMRA